MAEEVAALSVRLEAKVARFERDIQRARRSMERATGRMERRATSLDRRLERVGNRFGINLNPRIIAATAALAGLGKALNDIVRNGDRLRQLEGRFRALTGSAERAGGLIRAAFGIGADTGASFEAVTEALTRFRIAGDAINATDEEVAQLTANLLKLGQIGGSTTQELTAGAIQLGQGLASGALRGEELRSVMENLPLVARQIAEGLNVSVGELREMGAEGELTAERVFGALTRGSDEIEARFAKLPVTVERAANSAATAWAEFTAELNESTGASDALVSSLEAAEAVLRRITDALRAAEGRGGGLSGFITGLAERATGEIFGVDIDAVRRRRAAGLAAGGSGVSAPAPVGSGGTRYAPQSFPGVPAAAPFKFAGSTPAGFGGFDSSNGGGGGGRAATIDDTAVQMLDRLRERIQLLQQEQALVGTSAVENARLTAAFERQRIEQELLNAASKEGATITPEQIAQAGQLADQFERESVALAQMGEALRRKAEAEQEAEQAAQRHAQAVQRIGDTITGAIQQADSFADALKNVALQLANIALQSLSQPGGGTFGSLFSGLSSLLGLGGGGSGFGSIGSFSSIGAFGYAKGAAFRGGRVTPFAAGGVVGKPTVFPMANGMGLMGEADNPEAIMPLKRGPGGRLGVEASGGGGNTYLIDARGADMAAVARLERSLMELAGPGKVERRAVAAVSSAQHRGHRLGPRG